VKVVGVAFTLTMLGAMLLLAASFGLDFRRGGEVPGVRLVRRAGQVSLLAGIALFAYLGLSWFVPLPLD
jgi:hypothetical protein